MREFKMKPVLPCFSGFVPYKFKELFPYNRIYNGSNWNNFET